VSKAIWTARCKSGFEYRRSDGKLHVCNKACGRGQLLCADCHDADVVPYWEDDWELGMERGMLAGVLVAVMAYAAAFAGVSEVLR